MSVDAELYDTVLIRDTCANSRTKIKNYFFHNIYEQKNFKYNSDYDELMLLDVLEGTKTQLEYLKRFIPFLIIIAFGALSWILWIVMCVCYKKPKGCLKRYTKTNTTTRRICFFIYIGFASTILILMVISIIYLQLSRSDLNGTICTLSMLRYEMMYGQSLLGKEDFKKPFWYGIKSLSDNIVKVQNLLGILSTNCLNKIKDSSSYLLRPVGSTSQEKTYNEEGKKLKDRLEQLYRKFNPNEASSKISFTDPKDASQSIIPLYISNMGYKENDETYTGKILYDYQIHYEYLINTITDPILEICDVLGDSSNPYTDLNNALDNYNDIIKTIDESMNIVANYITNYLSKYLVNLKSIYFLFFFILLILMGATLAILTILISIYYFKPMSALFSSIKSMLYFMNFLMIFGLIFSGITGVFSIYFANASDIIDCTYSSKNIGSDNPRVIPRTTDSSVLTRCIRGDGNLLDKFSSDNARKVIYNLKKLNSIYMAIIDANKRMNPDNGENNVYNTLNSIEKVIQEFTFMKDEFSLTTSKKEHGELDITYMLNELNRYTFAGMKYQKICPDATYDIWTLRQNTNPTVQIQDNEKAINSRSVIHDSIGTSDYTTVCPLQNNPFFTSIQTAATKYHTSLTQYNTGNQALLNKILNGDSPVVGLSQMKDEFQTDFIDKMKITIKIIKEEIADPFWKVFGELVNDKTKYSGIEDAEKIDIFGWLNCSVLGKNYNITMNTIKTTFVTDLKVVTYCSLISEGLIIALYFIIVSLANNIRDKEYEKNENKYDIESKKDDGEIFEIVQNNKYKDKYEYEGELITFSKKHKNKSKAHKKENNSYITTNEDILYYKNDKTNEIINKEDIDSIKKDLPKNMITVPKIDIAENIEAIKNVDMRKLVDKQGKAVMHPIRLSINSPLGVMEASDKYAHKYTYDIFEPVKEDDSENNNSGIENGSFYQNNKKDKKDQKDKKKKGKDKDKDKKSNKSSEFSF